VLAGLLGGFPLTAAERGAAVTGQWLKPTGFGFADRDLDGDVVPTLAGPRGDFYPERREPNIFPTPFYPSVMLAGPHRGIVVDLGQLQGVEAVAVATDMEDKSKLEAIAAAGTLEVWLSDDNVSYRKLKVDLPTVETLEDGKNGLLFRTPGETARFAKVRWNSGEMNKTLVSKPGDALVRAFGEPGPAAASRVRIDGLALQEGANKVGVASKNLSAAKDVSWSFLILKPHTTEVVAKVEAQPGTDSDGFRNFTFKLPAMEPGAYDLDVRCDGMVGGKPKTLWTERMETRFATKLVSKDLKPGESLTAPGPGELLIVHPGAAKDLPLSLKGNFAVSALGAAPEDAVVAKAGAQTLTPRPGDKTDKNVLREQFLGFVLGADGTRLSITEGSPQWLAIWGLTPRQTALAAGKQDLSKDKAFIFVNDGFSIMGNLHGTKVFGVKQLEADAGQPFKKPTVNVERFDWCPGSSTVVVGYTSSVLQNFNIGEVGPDVRPVDVNIQKNVRQMMEEGYPPMTTFAEFVRKNGGKCYAAVRVNTHYDIGKFGSKNFNSALWWEKPEWRMQRMDGTQISAWSMVQPEVIQFYLRYYRELLSLGMDGLHFEMLRHPRIIGYEPVTIDAFQKQTGKSPLDPGFSDWDAWYKFKQGVFTQFMRDVRKLVDEESQKHGRKFGFSIRIQERGYKELGFDPQTWIDEGLIDMLCVGSNRLPNSAFNLEPFLKMVKGTPVKLYSSFSREWGDSRDPDPEDHKDPNYKWHTSVPHDMRREFVVNQFAQGAEGIYMFNSHGDDREVYMNLQRWDEFENPKRLFSESTPATNAIISASK